MNQVGAVGVLQQSPTIISKKIVSPISRSISVLNTDSGGESPEDDSDTEGSEGVV